jgi:16S rRNA (cytosine967-C5)-methyltransferase
VLEENLTRLGAEIVGTTQCDWTREDDADKIASLAPFDRVLVDAPCSNTGVIRRRVDVRWRLKPVDFKRMQKHQIAIVRAVLPLLKRGGVLVYSTCSVEPEENEEIVRCFATDVSTLRLEQEKRVLPFRDHFDGAFAAKFVKGS